MQTTQRAYQMIVIGGTVAEEYDIGWGGPQALQAVGDLTTAARDLHTRLPAKGTAQ
ncbi:MAG TPA: hypothetical protein VEI01_04585 [Terriglobales bacterium]|nr:hypothetical protein [Terriglobales bacterium]